ncbi:MAG: hypothetical protein HYW24_02885 [Candidatus Aenigmarchaeota archaeon]|nr:hypothetical protein [Candidatus Aenigmarchaeota archaeon]
MKRKAKTKDEFGFWKFLIVLSVALNAVNFYYVNGLYNVINKDVIIPLSNTAVGDITGYFVYGYSPWFSLVLMAVILAGYFIFRKFN